MYPEPPFDPRGKPETERAPALAKRLQRFLQAANGAFSSNTERAVRSDLAIYAAWCAGRGERALPASPGTVAAFVDAMAEARAPATVRRYVTSIGIAQRALGLEKTLNSPEVRLALKRMHRRKGRRQDQAAGLTWPLRRRLLEAAGGRLIDDRNRALLAVAYDAMLRRAELTSLEVSDFLEEIGGDGSLLVRRSKTDGEGRGEIVWIGPDTVRLVYAWLDLAGITDGKLFRSVAKGGRIGEGLDPCQVPRIFKAMAREAGLPDTMVESFSGHSARVGAAQDMVAAGIELPAILHAGRWKSTAMVNRYGERLLARRSGADAGTDLRVAGGVRLRLPGYSDRAAMAARGRPNPARAGVTGANPENAIERKIRRGERVRYPAGTPRPGPADCRKALVVQRVVTR